MGVWSKVMQPRKRRLSLCPVSAGGCFDLRQGPAALSSPREPEVGASRGCAASRSLAVSPPAEVGKGAARRHVGEAVRLHN